MLFVAIKANDNHAMKQLQCAECVNTNQEVCYSKYQLEDFVRLRCYPVKN